MLLRRPVVTKRQKDSKILIEEYKSRYLQTVRRA